ncbi:MAG TPA: MASE4 domain-containing protein [Casimicrobiaceae bacterium]|nr:MASE4 domain-containing protein [Casimicrobiaceae bacterium]
MTDDFRYEPQAFLSTLPPGRAQRRFAASVALLSAAVFVTVAPFAKVQLAQVWAFIPAYQSATVITDLITAVLLFGQFAILRSRALLALASGYLFTSFIAFAHMLTFPGLFAPSGLLGAGEQTTASIYMFWHAVFPLTVIAYARLDGHRQQGVESANRPVRAIVSCVAGTLVATCALTASATVGRDALPAIMSGNRYTPAMFSIVSAVWVVNVVALVLLWKRRPRSVLDLWILVVLCAWLFDIALAAVLNAGRFDLGFYAGRIYGLLASSVVLIVLLLEYGALYARLAATLQGEQGERRRAEERSAAHTAELDAVSSELKVEAGGRRRAETDASEARQRLAGIIDSAMDAIITVDEEQRIVLFNSTAEALFGCPQSEALGASLDRFIPERFRSVHSEHIKRFGEGGVASRRMAIQRVVTGVRRGSEEFPIEASISQVKLHDRKYYTVIVRDVTERLRADEALRRSRQELHEMATVGATAREQEKSRIARELHDELAQSLTALRMDVDWLRQRGMALEGPSAAKLAAMEKMLDRNIAATRRIAADLRPLMLDDLGLVPAAQWLVENFRERHGVECEIAVTPPDLELADPHATAVFRIIQESLANVARHAEAKRVEVDLSCGDCQIRLRVRDDGRGFDPTDPRKPNSFGLVGLRERAHLVDGEIRIDSAPGRGTSIEVRIPFERRAT